jgi:hypothetical protein
MNLSLVHIGGYREALCVLAEFTAIALATWIGARIWGH